ncbi:MAG TPA: LamG domain-containing protein [Nannocystaceae bacterium]|nr:LamG domain-containing protein [Nannocystaceae bacterium]
MRKLVLAFGGLSLACGFDASGAGGGVEASVGSSSGSAPESTSSTASTTGSTSTTQSGDPTSASTTSVDESSTTSADDDDSSSSFDPSRGSSSESTGEPEESPWCDARRDDLVACYAFDDLAGGVLVDDAAPGNDGTVSNVGIDDGPIGEAAVFSSDSEVSVPASAATDLPDTITIELFLRVDAIPDSGRAGIIDRDGQWSIFLFSDGQLRCGASVFTYADVPALGEWMHLACVVGDGWTRLYLDGALASEVMFNGGIAIGYTSPLAIGDNSPGFDEPLDGAISGLRIWSTTRTEDELCEGAGDLCP